MKLPLYSFKIGQRRYEVNRDSFVVHNAHTVETIQPGEGRTLIDVIAMTVAERFGPDLQWHIAEAMAEAMRAAQRLPRDKRYVAGRKLTPEAVRAIREESASASLKQLAKRHGVSHTAISRIVSGETYRDVS